MIADGGVCVADGRIIAVGPFVDLVRNHGGGAVVDCEDAILTPALINAHVHLELSHLAEVGDAVEGHGDLPAWISTMIAGRERGQDNEAEIIRAGRLALDHLYATGTGLVADIGNRPASCAIGRGAGARVCFFLELLGMSMTASDKALAVLDREEDLTVNLSMDYEEGFPCGRIDRGDRISSHRHRWVQGVTGRQRRLG